MSVYGPEDAMPNCSLRISESLTVISNSYTVESRTLLSEMLGENMGTCHWAACTNYGG